MEFKMNIWGLIILIAGILAAVSVFLAWFSYMGFSATGWDIYDMGSYYKYSLFPLLILIAAIVAIIFALFELLGIELLDKTITRIITLVLGVVILVLALVIANDADFKHIAYGGMLEFVAALVLIIVPLLLILKVLPDN